VNPTKANLHGGTGSHCALARIGRCSPSLASTGKGPIKKDGPNVDMEVFAFLTTLPNRLTEMVNHERSPVSLTEEGEYETWLTGTPEEAFDLIRISDPDKMAIVQSGFEKKDLLTVTAMETAGQAG
jgi:putative SOS response-associated peptidase YedK